MHEQLAKFQSFTVSSHELDMNTPVLLEFQSKLDTSFPCAGIERIGFCGAMRSQILMVPSPEQLARIFSFSSLQAMSKEATDTLRF